MSAFKTATCDLRVDLDRLRKDILELAEIGRDSTDHGIYRMAFTEADMQGRDWLRSRMREHEIAYHTDGAGNIIGHWPADNDRPAVVIGSHMDTVPCGGHLDGSLGVLCGLEVVRKLKDSGLRPHYPVELVAFSDEEGRFGGMFGSEAFCGKLTPESILKAQDLNGVKLADAMRLHGLDPMEALAARRDPATLHAYFELHIEQGPVLSEKNVPVGVVEHIAGLFRWSASLIGKANHAGTTPMDMRNDAFLGLAEFANELTRVLEENGGPESRATIGNVSLSPGAANTIPGQCVFSLDVRDVSRERLYELRDAFRKALSAIARRRQLKFEFDEVNEIEPVTCAPQLVKVVREQSERIRTPYELMPSGAAHDAQMMGSVTDVAMIFVPSEGGRSHSPAEWTSWQDIEHGANVLLHSVMQVCDPKTFEHEHSSSKPVEQQPAAKAS